MLLYTYISSIQKIITFKSEFLSEKKYCEMNWFKMFYKLWKL